MNRKEFLKQSAALGIGLPFLSSLLSSCGDDVQLPNSFDVNFSGNVIVIGAGSAGMMASYLLQQHGTNYTLLEASDNFGGRVKKAGDFADFPIDLGAEWIHTDPEILAELINDPSQDASIDIINYRPETIYVWKNNELKKRNFFSNFYGEYKFKSTTWYDFFDQYIVPSISDNILYNEVVQIIDYSSDQVQVITNNNTYTADRIILATPLTTLINERINFQPSFPSAKTEALNGVDMPAGLKIFVEFSERFYPDIVIDGGLLSYVTSEEEGDKAIYDAAFGKNAETNVLALFTVGVQAKEYTDLGSDEEIFAKFMDELDEMFDGKASQYYVKHVVQNWTAEEFIEGSYSHYTDYSTRPILGESVDNKIYFAGEAYAPESDLATVHGAGISAFRTVEELLKIG